MTVLIKLTTAGTDTGPFYLYSDADNYKDPFEPTTIDKSALVAGYTSTVVPDTATIIRVISVGNCVTSVDIVLSALHFPVSLTYGATAEAACSAASATVFNL